MPDLPTAIDALRRAHPERDFLLLSASISRKLHRELSLLIKEDRKNPQFRFSSHPSCKNKVQVWTSSKRSKPWKYMSVPHSSEH